MKMAFYPHYCGGRILVGLYNHTNVQPHAYRSIELEPLGKEEFIKKLVDMHTPVYGPGVGGGDPLSNHMPVPNTHQGGGIFDPFQFVPYGLDAFQEVLRRMTRGHHIGVISCVTNSGQIWAASHLEKSGFKKANFTNKSGISDQYGCIHWTGDYWRDVAPALQVSP